MKWRVLILMFFALAMAHGFGQGTDSTVYAKQFPGATVGAKVTAAMASCNPSTSIPCIIVIEPSLASAAPGTLPSMCGHCYLQDWRNGPPSSGAIPAAPAHSVQIADGTAMHLASDPNITIDPVAHALKIGSVSNGVHVGALGSPTNWNFDTTTPATALASLGGGGSGVGFVFVVTQTVSGSSTPTITFSSIPQTASTLQLTCVAQSYTNAGYATITLNGDSTSTNYSMDHWQSYAGSVITQVMGNQIFEISSPDQSQTNPAAFTLTIPAYTNTTFNKGYDVRGDSAESGEPVFYQSAAGVWASSAAITSIALTAPTPFDWVSGSTCTLRGLP